MNLGEDMKKEGKASSHVGHGAVGPRHRTIRKTVRLTAAEFARLPVDICFSDYVRVLMAADQNTDVVAQKCRTITRVDFRRASDAESKLCHAAIYAIKRIDALALRLSTVSGNVSPQVAAELADARDLFSSALITLLDRP